MTDQNDTLAHRWFAEVWNKGREEAVDEMFAEDAIAHGLSDGTGNEPRGPAGFKPFYQSFRSAFPDIHITVEDTVCEGDKIVARCRVTATHTGDGLGIPATGKPVDFKGVAIIRVGDGKIIEAWNHFDFIDLYQQIEAFQLVNETVVPKKVVMPDHPNDFALHTELAKRLPDIPRYVETRAMLLANHCEIFGFDEADRANFVVCHKEIGTISIIGKPASKAILQAVESGDRQGDVLAFEDNFSFVEKAIPDWQSERAVLHRLGDSPSLPVVPDGLVRFLWEGEVTALTDLSDELEEELMAAAKLTQIAATIVDKQPVSFCYAGAITETLWDISIDTVEGYRNRGLAALCVAFMIDEFNKHGKRPVWGAFESNTASMKLAAKLGFVPVDELFVFER